MTSTTRSKPFATASAPSSSRSRSFVPAAVTSHPSAPSERAIAAPTLPVPPTMKARLLTEATACRCLDRDDIAGGEVARHLRRQRFAVEEVATRCARGAAALALRRLRAALADDREPAVLEHAEFADDAVAAAVASSAARPEPERVALDAKRVLQLERLDRSRQRVRHRDVDTARAVGLRTGTLAAADRFVVREAVVPEGHVVHRALPLPRHVDGLTEG